MADLLLAAFPPELAGLELAPPAGWRVACTGAGALAAAVETTRLIYEERPSRVLFIGTCGAYDGRFAIGDIVCAQKVLTLSLDELEGRAYRPALEVREWNIPSSLPFPPVTVAATPAITRSEGGARLLAEKAAVEHLELSGVLAAVAQTEASRGLRPSERGGQSKMGGPPAVGSECPNASGSECLNASGSASPHAPAFGASEARPECHGLGQSPAPQITEASRGLRPSERGVSDGLGQSPAPQITEASRGLRPSERGGLGGLGQSPAPQITLSSALVVANRVGPHAHREWLENHEAVSRLLVEALLNEGII